MVRHDQSSPHLTPLCGNPVTTILLTAFCAVLCELATLRSIPESSAQNFYSHLIGQNVVRWPCQLQEDWEREDIWLGPDKRGPQQLGVGGSVWQVCPTQQSEDRGPAHDTEPVPPCHRADASALSPWCSQGPALSSLKIPAQVCRDQQGTD